MATIAPQLVSVRDRRKVWLWETAAGGDTCTEISPNGSEPLAANIHAFGTFGGTLTMQGSNDGTNWFTLKDTQGNDCTATSEAVFEVSTAAAYLRPSPGSGISDIDVTICLRG